jgi:hypothetical protein
MNGTVADPNLVDGLRVMGRPVRGSLATRAAGAEAARDGDENESRQGPPGAPGSARQPGARAAGAAEGGDLDVGIGSHIPQEAVGWSDRVRAISAGSQQLEAVAT